MDSFELNKIAGAVLGTMLIVFGIGIVGDLIFSAEEPETPGYVIAVATEPEGGEEPAAEPEVAIATLLADADPAAGESAARPCSSCHTFEEGGPNRIGPNLWGIVERPIASVEGFGYSDAMQAFAEEAGTWSYEHLDAFLAAPREAVPGTTMSFAGVRDSENRADLIAWLRTLASDPVPLPEPPAETPQPAAGTAEPGPEQPETAPAGEEQAQDQAAQEGAAQPQDQESVLVVPPADQSDAQQQAQAEPTGEEPADEAPAEGEQQAEAPGGGDLPPALALMSEVSVEDGQAEARKCQACHALEEGGGIRVGPPLWDVVNRPIAAVEGFSYSDAMQEFGEGREWDFAALDAFIADPRSAVPGNKMAFPGIRNERDRAELLVYLNSLSGEPAPLPGTE